MPTKKSRINISISPRMKQVLQKMADRDSMPLASKALELIEFAVDIEEDEILDLIATSRENDSQKFFALQQAWK